MGRIKGKGGGKGLIQRMSQYLSKIPLSPNTPITQINPRALHDSGLAFNVTFKNYSIKDKCLKTK